MFKGRDRGREQRDLPAPGDRAGHLRQLQQRPAHDAPAEDAVRHLPDRQVFRNEITPAASSSAPASLSRWSWSSSACRRTDLEWFRLLAHRYCHEWLKGLWACKEEHLRLRDHRSGRTGALFQGDDGLRIPLPLRLGRALGRCRAPGFRPEASIRRPPARAWST